MNTKKTYDVIVVGAGSAGLTSAVGFTKIGKKVLLVEREHMGGECTNSGCVPSKALLHHAKAYHRAQQIAGVSPQAAQYRDGALSYGQNKIDEFLQHESPEDFEKIGIDVVMGEEVFTSPRTLVVGDTHYGFNHAIIATGSSPRPLTIKGLAEDNTLTNQNVFQIGEIPRNLVVVGGGPIGMELGQAFAMLGSAVTIVTNEERFASHEEEEVSEVLYNRFKQLGITIHLNAHATHVTGNHVQVEQQSDQGTVRSEVSFDKVLVAIGRVPNIPRGLTEALVKHDERCIMVNKNYRTSNKYIFAIGDVTQVLKFTHTADDTARQVVTHLASRHLLRVNNRKAVPKVTFTEPEVASVGLTHDAICEKYDCSKVFRITIPYSSNDRAKTDDSTDGLAILTVRRLSGAILGVNIVGPAAGELIALFTLAIDQKISMWGIRSTIYAYPTYALLAKKAGDMFFALTIANLKPDLVRIVKNGAPKVLALVFWIAIVSVFHGFQSMHNLSYTDMFVMLFDLITTSVWGPALYMLVYAMRPLIFFPATLLTALSGALFGLPFGILYTVLGENLSANFAYGIGRFFGKDLRLEDSFIGNWVEALKKRPFGTVLFMRLFYVPFDLTNYGAGILRVPWVSYLVATFIGIMPGLVTFVALGAGIEDIQNFSLTFDAFNFVNIGIAVTTFILSIVVARILRRWKPVEMKQN